MFGKKEVLAQLAAIEIRELRHHNESMNAIEAIGVRLDAICDMLDHIKEKENPCDAVQNQNALQALNLRVNHSLSYPEGK